MEIQTKAFLIHGLGNVEKLFITVTEQKKDLIIGALKLQKEKIKNIFKKLQKEGTIKTIKRPKNKRIQKELDELVEVKRQIVYTLEQIKITFN